MAVNVRPFSVKKYKYIKYITVNIVMFFCGRSLAGGRKSPLTASLMLAVKSVSLFFLTITGEIQILPAYVRSLTVRDRDCYLKMLTLTDEPRLADPHSKDGRFCLAETAGMH